MENLGSLIILIISSFILIFLAISLKVKTSNKNQIKTFFFIILILTLIWSFSLILQILFQNSSVDPVFFEGIASFGACFVPVTIMLFGIVFAKTKISFTPKIILLYTVPILSTILMFTNKYHHLMYEFYSIKIAGTVFGKYFVVHSVYSYTCILIGLLYLIIYMIKNSGFFSKQSLLIFTGISISLGINIVATLGILDLTVYATPVSFTIAFLLFAFAIFRFDFLKVAPIALQKIVDRMSDGYIVINEDNIITDFNRTFLDLFSLKATNVRNKNIVDLINEYPNLKVNLKLNDFKAAILKTKTDNATVTIKEHFETINKYFRIEINSITSKKSFLGTLILLKDVTQHNIDMQTIKSNQEMLIEKERLATLGQMIGGIAHNLKTPIMSISGAAEGISDLVKEYDVSIEDSEVTHEDHHAIAHDMDEWIEKIRTHLAYMSDVITAVKGQAVTFSDNSFNGFTVDELIKHVDILMKHELKNALINLNTTLKVPGNTKIDGNINSLVQVINNIISNAIQAYNGRTNETIDFSIYSESKDILTIKIKDNAGGLPDKVQKKLFKEMITTKGKNGTGLGLFMSYSNIKAHFSGNMRFESKKNKGTSFFIEIPI